MKTLEVDISDRLSARRAQACIALAVVFVSAQAASFSPGGFDNSAQPHEAAWTLWAATLLLLLVLASGLLRPPGVRQMMSDETTVDHRRRAFVAGFWGCVGASLIVFLVDLGEQISGGEAARLIVTFATASALIRFGQLERRALRHG